MKIYHNFFLASLELLNKINYLTFWSGDRNVLTIPFLCLATRYQFRIQWLHTWDGVKHEGSEFLLWKLKKRTYISCLVIAVNTVVFSADHAIWAVSFGTCQIPRLICLIYSSIHMLADKILISKCIVYNVMFIRTLYNKTCREIYWSFIQGKSQNSQGR